MYFTNNTTDPAWSLQEKQPCDFQQYINPSCIYGINIITTSALPQVRAF